jgi:hypothetical protein
VAIGGGLDVPDPVQQGNSNLFHASDCSPQVGFQPNSVQNLSVDPQASCVLVAVLKYVAFGTIVIPVRQIDVRMASAGSGSCTGTNEGFGVGLTGVYVGGRVGMLVGLVGQAVGARVGAKMVFKK